MASIAQAVPSVNRRVIWFWEFLKEELAPYQGRGSLVARMVVASTIVMIVNEVFRLPYGAYGAIFALILSRTSLETTASAVRMLVIGFSLAGTYVILGLMLALADPVLRVTWIAFGLFVGFWAMRVVSNYADSIRFGYLIAVTITLWDSHISSAQKVENTLWAVGVISLASIITLLVEMVFEACRPSDDLIDGVTERLDSVEQLLKRYANGEAASGSVDVTLARLAMTGTSRMRLILRRSGGDSQYATTMGAVVGLTGRLVDLAANLPYFSGPVSERDRERIGQVARRIRELRDALTRSSTPRLPETAAEDETPSSLPLFIEIDQTASLISQVLTGSTSLDAFAPSPSARTEKPRILVAGDLLAPQHIQFALRGCFAATSCYVIFNVLAWPEISTAVTTCVVTALTTIGASRQKQVLRFAGALVGGFVIGIGSQVFILPYIDSITGFTILYIAVITMAAWIETSSPRLSYFGTQLAVVFSFITLLEYKFQTSLTLARDRAVGVLLGLFMMWLFFDQFWSKPAGSEIRSSLVSALRLLGRFARGPVSSDLKQAIDDSYALRDEINAQFDRGRSLADGVLFEFGPNRSSDLALRAWIRHWLPQLRALFVMRIASFKYRLRAPGFELLPDALRALQAAYDDASARMLEEMADRIEKPAPGAATGVEQLSKLLERTLGETETEALRVLPATQAQSFVTLLRGIATLTNSLATEVMTEFPK